MGVEFQRQVQGEQHLIFMSEQPTGAQHGAEQAVSGQPPTGKVERSLLRPTRRSHVRRDERRIGLKRAINKPGTTRSHAPLVGT
jgi:hypothetical protein